MSYLFPRQSLKQVENARFPRSETFPRGDCQRLINLIISSVL